MNCGIEKNYFIDPLLTVGEIDDNYEFIKDLKPFYFLTPPLFFLENHLPYEEKYQFVSRTLKVKEFTRKNTIFTENFYNRVFKYNITLQNRTSPEFDCNDSETIIKFIVANYDLEVELILNGKKLPEDNVKITDNDLRSNYEVTLIFPTNGEYKLNIIGKQQHTINEEKYEILSYKINVKITNIISHEPKPKAVKKRLLFLILGLLAHRMRKSKMIKGIKKLVNVRLISEKKLKINVMIIIMHIYLNLEVKY